MILDLKGNGFILPLVLDAFFDELSGIAQGE